MWLQAEHVCVFSAMEGTITFQGKPAVGAEVVRKVEWDDKQEKPDSIVTDEAGRFSFPVMNRVLRRLFPVEFVARQDVIVYYRGEEYLIWHMAKGEGKEYEEFGGKLVNFRCELTDELVRVEVKDGLLGTSCKWDAVDREHVK